MRISVDGRRICNNKVAFSNLSGIVWTGPKTPTICRIRAVDSLEPVFLICNIVKLITRRKCTRQV